VARIVLKDLVKEFGAFIAVKGINLDIRDGEFLIMVGPSGCGKTTTLNMISGLITPSSGDVMIGDRVVTHTEPGERGLGMVFQDLALFPHMTVFNNIAFPLKAHKMPRAEIPGKVNWAAGLFGIGHLLARKPRELSGGERQRVALARAVVREPQVFLLDEPLSNLDAKLRVEMRAELKLLHQGLGATMLYVTHDQEEAMTLGDRLVDLDLGPEVAQAVAQDALPPDWQKKSSYDLKKLVVMHHLGKRGRQMDAATIQAPFIAGAWEAIKEIAKSSEDKKNVPVSMAAMDSFSAGSNERSALERLGFVTEKTK